MAAAPSRALCVAKRRDSVRGWRGWRAAKASARCRISCTPWSAAELPRGAGMYTARATGWSARHGGAAWPASRAGCCAPTCDGRRAAPCRRLLHHLGPPVQGALRGQCDRLWGLQGVSCRIELDKWRRRLKLDGAGEDGIIMGGMASDAAPPPQDWPGGRASRGAGQAVRPHQRACTAS